MPRWRNWQTHYLEVVAPRGMEVRVLSWAPFVILETLFQECFLFWFFDFAQGIRYNIAMNRYIIFGKGVTVRYMGQFWWIIGAVSTYACLIPLVIVDLFVWQFQNIYFRLAEIPRIERRKYVILDRYQLAKLTFFQKVNCLYCEYANGVVAYAKAVVNQMELYSCAIKHASHPLGQEHQKNFRERKEFE